jgi:hemin uptake protein HemP
MSAIIGGNHWETKPSSPELDTQYHQWVVGSKQAIGAKGQEMVEEIPERGALPLDTPGVAPRVVHSCELFGPQRMVLIEHAGQVYRLSITRNDRLILQK